MSKFKIGDIVVANKSANDKYSVTTEGWVGKVVEIDEADEVDDIRLQSIEDTGYRTWVSSACFELCTPAYKASAKNGIKKVIFNAPATIVLWTDNTKTVVKCGKNDTYDLEKGLALCIAKKYLGNQGNFNNVFKEWLPKSEEVCEKSVKELLDEAVDGMFEPFGGDVK